MIEFMLEQLRLSLIHFFQHHRLPLFINKADGDGEVATHLHHEVWETHAIVPECKSFLAAPSNYRINHGVRALAEVDGNEALNA